MPDTTTSTPADKPDTKSGTGFQIGASFLAAGIASYAMTQASLHGVNFEVLGVSSELVKATIIAHLVAFFTWASPKNVSDAIRGAIIFVKKTLRSWHDAWTNNEE